MEKYLGVEELTGEQKDAIKEYLKVKIKEEDGRLYYSYQYKNALIYWKTEEGDVLQC